MCLTLATWVTAPPTTAGWSVLTSIILLMLEDGPQQQLVAEFGATAAWPAMASTCLWLRATHSTRAAIGWAAKQLFGCKPDQPSLVNRPTIGCQPTGSRST